MEMPWVIGIDEAGYGPNLGPLVMTTLAFRLPDGQEQRDLWTTLAGAVRRHPSDDDGRILVEDSKVVYSSTRGLAALETGVWAALASLLGDAGNTVADWLEELCPRSLAELAKEKWYRGTSLLPVEADATCCASAAELFRAVCVEQKILACCVRSVLVCPPRFNGLLESWGSKGAVLGQCLTELLQFCRGLDEGDEPLSIVIDKHGGRNTYTGLLQTAFPDCFVMAREECMERSVYHVFGAEREITLSIEPRADANHFCVALASMISKYLRELLMLEFNHFWQKHVPGLKPTAGYPGDAARYFKAIRPAVRKLGLHEDAVWRRK
jgi:hypothetical protein